MGRPPRIDPAGGWYHVMNRGAARQAVFRSSADGELFLSLLAAATERHRVEVHAYCLMPNHFHLLVHCPEGGLSRFIHAATAPYSRTFNGRVGRDGPLFRARFRSLPVDTPEYRMSAGRYIHRNPVDLDPLRALAAYRWSSYASYVGERATPAWLVTSTLLSHVASVAAYRDLVECDGGLDLLDHAGVRQLIELVVDERTDARGSTRRDLIRVVLLALLDDCGPRTAAGIGRALGVDPGTVSSPERARARRRAVDDPQVRAVLRQVRAAAGLTVPGTTPCGDAVHLR